MKHSEALIFAKSVQAIDERLCDTLRLEAKSWHDVGVASASAHQRVHFDCWPLLASPPCEGFLQFVS